MRPRVIGYGVGAGGTSQQKENNSQEGPADR